MTTNFLLLAGLLGLVSWLVYLGHRRKKVIKEILLLSDNFALETGDHDSRRHYDAIIHMMETHGIVPEEVEYFDLAELARHALRSLRRARLWQIIRVKRLPLEPGVTEAQIRSAHQHAKDLQAIYMQFKLEVRPLVGPAFSCM
jgi:hypothetical protein